MSTTNESRERLVAAARDLYASQGVGATSPRQVLAASGVGQGSLYHHFPAKHDLALAAVSATVADSLAAATGELGGDRPALDRLRAYLERPRDTANGCRIGRLTSDQTVMSDAELAAQVGSYFSGLVECLTEVFVEAGVPDGAASDRAYAALAIVQGGYVLARALADPTAMQRAVRGFVSMLAPAPEETA
ncbi:TetR/AcrR family transcriptional regulator [Occultella glacieicola]|uniref:TetR/AcrR family transcriptional regulator n=1 Tax=Occultella glacieicola TaxID=2518684 RepID=UPI0014049FF7|nr:TetR/AcrR family transcriptional regulator [Occultella glacieicola]